MHGSVPYGTLSANAGPVSNASHGNASNAGPYNSSLFSPTSPVLSVHHWQLSLEGA